MRAVTREDLNRLMAVGGAVVILLQVAFITSSRLEVTVVLTGILINQIGVWGLASRLMPERRKYMLLRAEVRHFLGLVTKLNESAVAGDDQKLQITRSAMLESVERMVPVAGIEEGAASDAGKAGQKEEEVAGEE